MYQEVINGVIRLSDGAVLPLDDPDYVAWLALGNTPRPTPPTGHHKWDDTNKIWYIDAEVQAKLDEDSANTYENKVAQIQANLPSWSEVEVKLQEIENLIPLMGNMTDAKVVLTKMMNILRKDVRVTYWIAKGTQS